MACHGHHGTTRFFVSKGVDAQPAHPRERSNMLYDHPSHGNLSQGTGTGKFYYIIHPEFLFLGCGVFFRARALLGRLVFYLRSQGFRARAFLWDLGDDKRQGPYNYLNFASTSLRNYFKIIRPRQRQIQTVEREWRFAASPVEGTGACSFM